MGSTGPIAQGAVDEQCEVEFVNVPAGTYQVSVSGHAITDGNGGTIEMTPTQYAEFEVKVRRSIDVGQNTGTAARAFVSASELAIPARAKKEFDKASELIAKQDFTKAIDKLKRAIVIYPGYANAYNNAGVVYGRLGDRVREREALQKAISINDHFEPAYVNLGRMNIAIGDFASAENALRQASSCDPTDAMTLVLLSYSQFMDKHFDEAIETSRHAHMLQGPHSSAHHIAARAFEQKHDAANAIEELQEFLEEEPTGREADAARKELATVLAIPH